MIRCPRNGESTTAAVESTVCGRKWCFVTSGQLSGEGVLVNCPSIVTASDTYLIVDCVVQRGPFF